MKRMISFIGLGVHKAGLGFVRGRLLERVDKQGAAVLLCAAGMVMQVNTEKE